MGTISGNSSADFTVVTNDDFLADNGEKYQVSIGSISGGSQFEQISLGTSTVITTITDETSNDIAGQDETFDDNDAITIKIVTVDSSGNVINGGLENSVLEGSGLAYYKVIAVNSAGTDISGQISGTVTVNFTGNTSVKAASFNTASGSSDYSWFAQNGTTALTPTISFGSNGTEAAVGSISSVAVGTILSITARSDGSTEGQEQFNVYLGNNLSTANAYELVKYGGAVTTSIGDALVVSSVTVSEDSATAGVDTGRYATFNVAYTAVTDASITLVLAGVSATANSDYVNSMEYSTNGTSWATYTSAVNPGNSAGTLQVRVLIKDDALKDSGETFTLTASRTIGGNTVSSLGTATIIDATANDDLATPILTDNDLAYTFNLVATTSTSINEETPGQVSFKLIAKDANGVEVANPTAAGLNGKLIVAVGDPSDKALPGVDYDSPMRVELGVGETFTVTALNDRLPDPNESFTVRIVDGSYSGSTTEFEKLEYVVTPISTTIIDGDTVAIPDAKDYTLSIVEGGTSGGTPVTVQSDTNLLIVMDVSGSMTTVEGSSSRLAQAKIGAKALLDKYDEFGDVKVQVVKFSSTATVANSGTWMTISAAKTHIDSLTASGYTNYDRALDTSMTVRFSADKGAIEGAQNVSYFFSDGNPTEDSAGTRNVSFNATVGTSAYETQDIGIQAAEEWAWKNFLNVNDVTSYAYAIGNSNVSLAYLNPIAWDGATQTDLNSAQATLSNLVSSVVIPVVTTVTPPPANTYTGNLITLSGSEGGPEGFATPILVSVANGTAPAINFAAVSTGRAAGDPITFVLASNQGSVKIYSDGRYEFTPGTGAADVGKAGLSTNITFTVADTSGDKDSAIFTINIADRSDVFVFGNTNVINIDTILTTTQSEVTNSTEIVFPAIVVGSSASTSTVTKYNFSSNITASDIDLQITDTNRLLSGASASSNTDKWLVTSVSGSNLDAAVSSGVLRLTDRDDDNDSDNNIAGAMTPTFEVLNTGSTVSFTLKKNDVTTADIVRWVLYKDDGSGSYSAMSGSNYDRSITGDTESNTLTFTTGTLSSGNYRLLITADDNNNNTDLFVEIDNISVIESIPAVTATRFDVDISFNQDELNSNPGAWLSTTQNTSNFDLTAGSSTGSYNLIDGDDNSADAGRLLTPVFTINQAGNNTISFAVSNLSDYATSGTRDVVTWTLYQKNGSGNFVALTGVGNTGAITADGTYTSGDLADGDYRLMVNADEKSSSSTGVSLTVSGFQVNTTTTDPSGGITTTYESQPVTGNVLTDLSADGKVDIAGIEGATLQVLKDSTFTSTSLTDTVVNGVYGTLRIKSDGSYTYTPTTPSNADIGNTETFTYRLIQADGDTSNANLVISIVAGEVINRAAPIALDLNNNGISYLSEDAGVTFDYNNDGIAESTAWVDSDDALLANRDVNGNLNIVFSTQPGETDLQGLAKVYDSNKDGVLDSSDTAFAEFGVWQDADSDGVVDSGEYLSLADRGITSLSLTSDGQIRFEANGDVIVYGQTTYTTSDGKLHIAEDVGFAVSDVDQPLDMAAIIANADALEAVRHIDQLADTPSSSSLMVELGGQTYEIATLPGQEMGSEDMLSQFAGSQVNASLLGDRNWTEVIDIESEHGGPGSILTAGGTLNDSSYANSEGDWTVIINSGDAKVDSANNQITFASESAGNSVTIVTADGASHDINNVDKIQWHG